jgi:hypothetical protein
VKYQGGELVTDIAVAIGKALGSSDVTDVLNSLAPVRVVEDPPFRTYIGSPKKGVDLLFENDRVVSIQIYTQATRTFSPFRGTLPLGLMMSMKQPDVHALLGVPAQSSNVSSKYLLTASSVALVLTYDEMLSIRLLSMGPIE